MRMKLGWKKAESFGQCPISWHTTTPGMKARRDTLFACPIRVFFFHLRFIMRLHLLCSNMRQKEKTFGGMFSLLGPRWIMPGCFKASEVKGPKLLSLHNEQRTTTR